MFFFLSSQWLSALFVIVDFLFPMILNLSYNRIQLSQTQDFICGGRGNRDATNSLKALCSLPSKNEKIEYIDETLR